jgi:predicted glycosyltransferase involved in capsule biosynthesis
MNKKSFIRAGMENENFISWGPEDSERFNRYHILGLTVQRIPGAMYHMDHYVGENSSPKNEHFKANEKEFLNVVTRNKNKLEEYINSWDWIN